MATKRTLIEKLKAGGQITVEDLESLGRKNKDPDARPAKVCSPKRALEKAKNGIPLNRWELENLATSPLEAVEYAKLKSERFPECESCLIEKGNRRLISEYFLDIVGQPNELFEKWLLDQQDLINRYCLDVRKSRWEEGEQALLKATYRWGGEMDPSHALAYQKEFGIGPWEALERLLLDGRTRISDRGKAVKEYMKNCGHGRHETVERRLLKVGNTYAIMLYAKHCVGGRLPDELHNKMVLAGKKGARRYVAWLASKKRSVLKYLASLPEKEREEMFPETLVGTG